MTKISEGLNINHVFSLKICEYNVHVMGVIIFINSYISQNSIVYLYTKLWDNNFEFKSLYNATPTKKKQQEQSKNEVIRVIDLFCLLLHKFEMAGYRPLFCTKRSCDIIFYENESYMIFPSKKNWWVIS